MSSYKRILKVGGLALLLAIIYLGTLLSVSGYCEKFSFVFIADSRSPCEGKAINTAAMEDLIGQILKLTKQPAFVIYGGDIASYGLNSDGSNNFVPFKACIKKLTDKGIKLYVALGNHELYKYEEEYWKKAHLSAQQQYQQVFADLPDNGPSGDYKKLVYSFESPGGDAFFAILDPYYLSPNGADEQEYHPGGAIDDSQLKWLESEIHKTKATHKFLCMHTPVYPILKKDTDKRTPTSFLRLWDLLDKARFDLFLCGHEHLYSRKAIDSNVDKRWQNKVVQLINGGAGAPAYEKGETSRDPMEWIIDVEYGKYYFTVVDIDDKQVAVSTYKGRDCKYSLIDQFTIQENVKAAGPGK